MNIEKPNKDINDKINNPFIEKENDIMLNTLQEEDRKILQEKLLSLYRLNTSLHLEYTNKEKRLKELEMFKEKLDDAIIYITNIYLILKGKDIADVKEVEESDFTEKDLSNLNLKIDYKKVDDFTFSSKRSLITLFNACKNLQAKLDKKMQEISEKHERQKLENEKEKSEVY